MSKLKGYRSFSDEEIKKLEEEFNLFVEESAKKISPNGLTISELVNLLEKESRISKVKLNDFQHAQYYQDVLFQIAIKMNPNNRNHKELINLANNLHDKYPDLDIEVYVFNNYPERMKPMILVEYTTNYIEFRNGNQQLWDEIYTKYGVCENDIKEKTDRFINYICCLRDIENNIY